MLWTEAEGTVTANSQEIRGEGGEPNLPRLVRGLSVSVLQQGWSSLTPEMRLW